MYLYRTELGWTSEPGPGPGGWFTFLFNRVSVSLDGCDLSTVVFTVVFTV
jgi:hypothetical protein